MGEKFTLGFEDLQLKIAKWETRNKRYDIKLIGKTDTRSWEVQKSQRFKNDDKMLDIMKTVDDANKFFDCVNNCYTVVRRKLNHDDRGCKIGEMCVDKDGKLEVEAINEAKKVFWDSQHYVQELTTENQ